MSDQKRQYRMKRRAEQEAETRQRITESAVALHGSLGPAQTSVSAIADRAGVQRSTVYRHFPDDEALFGACSQHWAERNPPPNIGLWAEISDPEERLPVALEELYSYYRRAGDMIEKLLRDEAAVPVVAKLFAPFHQFLDVVADALMQGRGLRGGARARVRAAIGHAVAFSTWQELTGPQGLDDEAAAGLMRRLIAAA